MDSDFTGVIGASLYLVGVMDGNMFLPSTDFFTCTQPTEEDGLTYILLGVLSASYSLAYFPSIPFSDMLTEHFSRFRRLVIRPM